MKRNPLPLIAFLCACCLPVVCLAQVDLNKGLMAYYPFNGNAKDASGNNNNPIFNNATLTKDYYGNANSAYHFNGVDNYMEIPNSASLNFGAQMSICVWVKPTGYYTGPCYNNMIVSKEIEDYISGNYSLRFSDAVTGCTSNANTNDEVFYGSDGGIGNQSPVQLNQWYSVVFTSNGITSKLYVNCNLVSSQPATETSYTNSYDVFLGHLNSDAYPYWLNGDLDEVRIYNRALTEEEVQAYSVTCRKTTVTASFTGPDSVCVNTPVQFTNTSQNASNYLWSFCSEFNTTPTAKNIGAGNLNLPVFIDYGLDDNGNYYGIVTNHLVGRITRLNFGNSLLNTPTSEDLGDFNGALPEQLEGVQLEHVNGKWYAIAVGGGNEQPNSSPRIVKLDFGNSLANAPVATNWGNLGNLDLPIDFYIAQENDNYYGFAFNVYSNTITRFDFGNDFANPPAATNLGNIGSLNYPDGFTFVKSNNTWYAFVVNTYPGSITRLYFGSSLTNTPTATVINNPGGLLAHPRDITLLSTCNGILGYVINANDNKLIKLNFGSDITNNNPAATDLGSYDFNFPHSFSDFFTAGGDIYTFVPNVNSNSIDRLKFAGCSTIKSTTKKNPDSVTYKEAGTYTVNLMVDIGLPTQTSFCKQIVVNSCVPPVTASFIAPDTICKNTPVTITNTSTGVTNYLWSFCGAFNSDPVSTNLGNVGNDFQMPVFSDFALDDNGNYYALVTNHYPGKITRLNFGNSLLNTPTAEDLGNFNGVVPNQLEGIQLVKSNGRWYAIAVGGGNYYPNSSPRIIKLDFGNSLGNTPVATNWGNIGNLDLPIDFYIAEENGNYYGFTMNVNSNTITRFDFGNDFSNPPSGTNLGNIGNLNYPDGFTLVNNNSTWYAFAVNAYGNTITRLDFGNSLINKPTAHVIANPGGLLNNSRDIAILFSCDKIYGYVINAGDNQTIKLDFGSDITSTPTAQSLGNPDNYNFPHSFSDFFTDGNDIYSFIPTVNTNSLHRIKFAGCHNMPSSTKQNPDPVIYDSAGVYTISLMADIGLPTQTSFCKQIVVNNCDTCNLKAGFTYSQNTCDPKTIQFNDTTSKADSIWWDFSDGQKADTIRNPIVNYPKYGNYTVHLYAKTKSGCFDTAIKTITVNVVKDSAIITRDTSICLGSAVQLNSINGLNYCWTPSASLSDSSIQNPIATPKVTTKYYLHILLANNQLVVQDSVTITVVNPPSVNAGNDVSVCKGSSVQLNASGANSYIWNYSSALSDTTIANPIATPVTTTNFIVKGFDNIGCVDTDTVKVTVLALPVIIASNDTILCGSNTTQINASGGVSYKWYPTLGLSDPNIANPIASPNTTTKYYVTGTDNNNCQNTDSVLITVQPEPVFSVTPQSSSICAGDSVVLTASGGDIYSWSPVQTVANPNASVTKVFPVINTTYTATITNTACKVTDSVKSSISVKEKPVVTISKSNDIDCVNLQAQLNATGGISFNWTPNQYISNTEINNPVVEPPADTWYFVTVKGENGCLNKDSILVKSIANSSAAAFDVPNAFTPNHDGLNDCFSLKNWGPADYFDMAIYDKWGYLVYHSNNIGACWDGTTNGKAQGSGTYVYKISVSSKCTNNVIVHRKGTIVLIR